MSIALYLGVLLFAFIITSIAIIPAIDVLYRIRFLKKEVGTPTGGGVLLIVIITSLFAVLFPLSSRFGVYITSHFPIKQELNTLFFTFVSFGLLGLYDDLRHVFSLPKSRIPQWILEAFLCTITAVLLYVNLHISIIYFPLIGVVNIGLGFIPFASLLIFIFTKGMQSTRDLNGLSSGLLLVALIALWVISLGRLDTPLSIFIAVWIGSLIAFLYFNVYPARVLLGSAGGLAFGATLPVTGLLLGRPVAVVIVGSLFIISALASLLLPKYSPTVLLQKIGWPEPKIAFRAWIAAIVLALGGLWLAGFS